MAYKLGYSNCNWSGTAQWAVSFDGFELAAHFFGSKQATGQLSEPSHWHKGNLAGGQDGYTSAIDVSRICGTKGTIVGSSPLVFISMSVSIRCCSFSMHIKWHTIAQSKQTTHSCCLKWWVRAGARTTAPAVTATAAWHDTMLLTIFGQSSWTRPPQSNWNHSAVAVRITDRSLCHGQPNRAPAYNQPGSPGTAIERTKLNSLWGDHFFGWALFIARNNACKSARGMCT